MCCRVAGSNYYYFSSGRKPTNNPGHMARTFSRGTDLKTYSTQQL